MTLYMDPWENLSGILEEVPPGGAVSITGSSSFSEVLAVMAKQLEGLPVD